MTSNNRGRLGEFVIGNGSKQSDAANLSMPPPIGSTYSSNNWNSRNIWGSTIGSGLKPNANELGRQPNKASFGNGDIIPIQMGGVFEPSEEITGSGSLLSTSESEGFARRASLQWPAMAGGLNGVNGGLNGVNGGLNGVNGGLNGVAGPQHNHRSASPGRPRTNQHTRSNSPFSNGQIPSMGASNGKASSTAFDPRSRSFNPSAVPFSNSGYDGLLISGRSDDPGRRQQQGMTYGGMGGFGNQAYSGYASSAASRSGSLPPSRHGNEPGAQLGDLTLNSLQANGTDVFSHRSNQHSRNNFSTPALNRLGDTTWGPPIGDLAVDVDRLDLDGETTAPYMSSQGMPPSPGSVNGAFNSFSFSRNGSVSYDPEARGSQQNLNQYRMGYGERPTHSPSDSEHRRSHDSPVYYSATPPMLDQYNRGSSGASSRLNMTGSNYNSATLDRKLRHVYEQQMHAGHSNPSSSFRQPYYNGFDGTPQAVARMNPTMQYYNGVPGGYQPHHGPTGRPAPRGPAVDTTPQPLRSPLLEEFRSSKGSKRYELKDIYGHVVEFSGDQHGSRFIQQKLETANSDEKAQLFSEILPNARQLMTDVFGNYVIQKFFEHGNQTQKKQLADMMKGYITLLSLQMYGCRVVQKAFEHILVDQQALLVQELESGVLKCVKDQNGNHVVQKAIERIPAEHIGFIIDAFTGQVQILATHPYGCRVVQRLLEHCPEPARSSILEELHACALALIVDQYGNYVAQHVIEHGRPEDKLKLITLTLNQLVTYSKHKFASNVVERCIRFGSDDDRRTIVDKITALDANGNSPLHSLMQHEYGNYVIQKLLKTLSGEEYNRFVDILRPCLTRARQFSYGKQIGQIDKLVDSLKTNKRSSPASSQRTSLALPSEKSSTPTPPPLTEDTNSPPSSSQPSTNASTVDGPASTPKADDSAEKKDLATPTFEVKADGDDATTVATPKPAFLES